MKYITTIVIILIAGLSVQAQTMTEIFAKIPGDQITVVDSVKRLDLMDLYKAGRKAEIKNNLDETCLLQSFSEDYLLLKNGVNTLELALLPMINDSKIVCLIQTVCAPVCDSRIEFYTVEWKQLDSKIFITPVKADWFFKETLSTSDSNLQNIRIPFDIELMRFHYDKEKLSLIQTYTTPEYLSTEDRKKAEPYLKNEPKVYQWKQTRFE